MKTNLIQESFKGKEGRLQPPVVRFGSANSDLLSVVQKYNHVHVYLLSANIIFPLLRATQRYRYANVIYFENFKNVGVTRF